MNLDSLSFALSQIGYSVANITKKNYKATVTEINHLTTCHGQEAERHLFRCLFSHIDFTGDGKSSGKDFHQIQLLVQECTALIAKPNCTSILCFAIDNPFQYQKTLKPSNQLISIITKILKLNKLQEVVFGLVLQHSANSETRSYAKNSTKQKFPELIRSYLDAETGGRDTGLQEAAVEVLHLLLNHLVHSGNPSNTSPELRDQFLAALRRDFPKERAPVILTPLLYEEKSNLVTDQLNPTVLSLPRSVMETSLADSLREIGYSSTSDKDKCRNTLTQLGGVREVTAPAVARVLGMMARTTAGLQDGLHMQTLNMPDSLWTAEQLTDGQTIRQGWNVEIFVQVIQELSPSLSWREVVKEFDHPGFIVASKAGLQLLVVAVRKVLHGNFPVEELYKPWTNTEGQLSWFVNSLKNPDVFCFAAFSSQHTVSIEMLKSPPDEDNIDVALWKSIDLVEILLKLSDKGHYQQVSELFKFPVQHCPDIILLNLLQTSIPSNTLKRELLVTLIPIFLGNHPNSGSILHYIWSCQIHSQTQALRTLVMLSMADWYLRGGDPNDQTRLSRILDVAQDLKALSMLLNAPQFTFVVDLACLASRREYLKLDKWLSDKIREHREPFIEAVVAFLKRRCPLLIGAKDEAPPQQFKGQLSHETVVTMLSILQQCAGNLQSEELSKDILTMVANAGPMLNKPRPIPNLPISGIPSGLMGLSSNVESTFGLNIGMQNSTPGGSPAKFNSSNITSMSNTSQANLQTINRQLHDMSLAQRGQANPASRSLSSQQPASQTENMPVTSGFAEEVEDEANSYFQKIYNQPPHPVLSIDEVLEMLKRFKDSSNRRERDVFSCMLRNLFEENRFFPQYPERELHITALLFGGIIEQGLVQHMALGLALRYVLEALKTEHNSKMYMFGIAALDRFKSRLKDCAQYCQHIVTIPHFNKFPPHLIEYVDFGKLSQEPPSNRLTNLSSVGGNSLSSPSTGLSPSAASLPPASPHTSQSLPAASTSSSESTSTSTSAAPAPRQAGVIGGMPSNKMGKPSLAHTTNIDTLLAGTDDKEEIQVPPETLQDKVFFIFNNLSQMNMQQKADELLEILRERDYIPWCAQYLVMKRASIEPNFHPLYSSFLDALNQNKLDKLALVETYRNIKVLLRSDKGVSNFSDRSLLKNLGHWLGLMTLAKNKPIFQLDLDLKSLLYEAYQKGSEELLYVVPFAAKVLESSEKSRVFKPPNPWTMGILNVLAELHEQQDLKLNLKFEIEVLCKNLHLEVSQLTPSYYLCDQSRLATLECQLTSRAKLQDMNIHYEGESNMAGQALMNLNVRAAGPSAVAPSLDSASSHAAGQPAAGMTAGVGVTHPAQPQYAYSDINISSLTALAPLIQANDHIPLFQSHKQLKQLVRPAMERAITELAAPVVDRSIKIAVTTCESIIKKDFALDPEEQRMRGAAHHLVRSMTAGMALITCREPLLVSISTNLKQAFMNALRGVTSAQKEMVEQAAQIIAQDNTELVCAFIQKTAVEKAIPEIDKRLAAEFELRYNARQEGRRYCDPVMLTYQAEKMPESIRLKVGSVTPQQMSVYEEFAQQVPGFVSVGGSTGDLLGQQHAGTHSKPQTNDEISSIYEKIAHEIETQLNLIGQGSASTSNQQQVTVLQNLMEALRTSARGVGDMTMSALALLQKTVEGLLEGYTSSNMTDAQFAHRFRECHLLVLKGLQDPRAFGPQWTNKYVTRCLTDCQEDYKYNEDAIVCLISAGLVSLPLYDYSLANSMESGLNYLAVAFAMQLVQRLVVDDKSSTHVTESDLCNTIEALARISTLSRQAPDSLPSLIEAIRQQNDGGLFPGSATGPTSMMQSGINQAKEQDDPQGLHEKTEYLLREWVNMYHSPNAGRDSTKAFQQFVTQMHQQSILKTDDLITRFFRLCTEMCVDLTYGTLKTHANTPALVRAKCFHTLDAYVRLIVLLVKLSGDSTNTMTKINLLNKVLGIVAGVLLQDHEVRSEDFQQLPYHRIFIMLFIELNAPEHILESINYQVLTAFVNTYRILRPAKVPGFAFAWLELISHRVFIGRMLQLTSQQRGWNMYAQLLIDLFKFLAPFLRNAELNRATQVLYKGTLRVLLVLLHDFPEFLCEYHYAFCDVIPPNCIQMRNLILSAFPRNMRLPDPFTPNLKVDMLTEIAHPPKIMTNVAAMIQPETFKKDLDSYLKSRSPVTFLSELRGNLQVNNDPGDRYNIPLINALVLYVGTQAIAYIQSKGMSPSISTIAHSSHMDIFQNLAVDLDTAGRYLFLNAITNQLRFPNSHTHYFSCVLLYLFSEANSEAIQEQITRVLLERLIVNRPHPWGLLVTFIELIRNQQFKFWSHDFVRCAPEIERLFETVARSCSQTRTQQPSNGTQQPTMRDNEISI